MTLLPPLLRFVDGTSDVIDDDCIIVFVVVVASFQKLSMRCSMEETNAAVLLRRVHAAVFVRCTPAVAACWIIMACDDGATVVTALPRLPSLPPPPPFTTAATTTLVVKTKNSNNNNNDDSPLISRRMSCYVGRRRDVSEASWREPFVYVRYFT